MFTRKGFSLIKSDPSYNNKKSDRADSNRRPLGPEPSTLSLCATIRNSMIIITRESVSRRFFSFVVEKGRLSTSSAFLFLLFPSIMLRCRQYAWRRKNGSKRIHKEKEDVPYILFLRLSCDSSRDGTLFPFLLYLRSGQYLFDNHGVDSHCNLRILHEQDLRLQKQGLEGPCSSEEIAAFFSCRITTGVINAVWMFVFVDVLHFSGVVMKLTAALVVGIVNYIAGLFAVFRKGRPALKKKTNPESLSSINSTPGDFSLCSIIRLFLFNIMKGAYYG